jgi:hypothetical protein
MDNSIIPMGTYRGPFEYPSRASIRAANKAHRNSTREFLSDSERRKKASKKSSSSRNFKSFCFGLDIEDDFVFDD